MAGNEAPAELRADRGLAGRSVKAAEQGHARAQNNLGFIYFKGQGVRRDYKEAVNWYRKAAEQGDAGAEYSLGRMYERGKGVARNYASAFAWYMKSAEQEYSYAQARLGEFYLKGRCVEQSDEKAFESFRKAAEQGHSGARVQLGWLYFAESIFSKGDQQSRMLAYKWLLLAPTSACRACVVVVWLLRYCAKKMLTIEQVTEVERGVAEWRPTPVQLPAPLTETIH